MEDHLASFLGGAMLHGAALLLVAVTSYLFACWSDSSRRGIPSPQQLGIAATTLNLCLLAAVAVVCIAPDAAFAQDLQPVTGVTQYIADFLTGPLATAAAIIAVAGVGYLFWTGRIESTTALTVVIGIGIVFGAPRIVQILSDVAKR
jgi:type IV secretory pathway VirB2 component (pilin)